MKIRHIVSSLPLLCVLSAMPAAALTIDSDTYFAFAAIPRPSRMHAQEYVLLTHKPCKATGVPSTAKVAIYYAIGESQGCWFKFNKPIISVCRVAENGEGPVGNDCYDIPQTKFIDTSTLPKTPKF